MFLRRKLVLLTLLVTAFFISVGCSTLSHREPSEISIKDAQENTFESVEKKADGVAEINPGEEEELAPQNDGVVEEEVAGKAESSAVDKNANEEARDLPPELSEEKIEEVPPASIVTHLKETVAKEFAGNPDVVVVETDQVVNSGDGESPKQAMEVEEEEIEGDAVSGNAGEEMVESSASGSAEESEVQESMSRLSDQELIDSALDYWQDSNDFWEQGELEKAIEALDQAYSLILVMEDDDAEPELLQQKEDLRITISRRVIEVYSSRHTVANGTHKAIPLEMNRHVEKALKMFKGRNRKFFIESYVRSGKYRPAIVRALKEAGLPEELSWLPLIESGFKVRALSSARALGIWQFIATTGYKFGLKRDTWIDERMDPIKATRAAVGYLTELHQIFGDWTTALAGYNCGEGRVLRKIRAQKFGYMDNFWDLYTTLPRETAFYVPKFLAVLHIINDPKAHGFDLPSVAEEETFDTVQINKQASLKTIAKNINIPFKELKSLNPELRQAVTPKTAYALKVPEGKAELLLAKIDEIPVYSPPVPRFVIHRVRRGESLSVIARRYKTSVSAIMSSNSLRKSSYIKAGWKLKIPTSRYVAAVVSSSTYRTASAKGRDIQYVVRKGDSLWGIAKRHKTTVKTIKSLNGLRSNSLSVGQKLKIFAAPSVASMPSGQKKEYMVRKDDSPYLIAKRHNMGLFEFLTLNSLTPKSIIYIGQKVVVHKTTF